MKSLSPREFSSRIKKGTLPSTVFFVGEEGLLMEKALQRIKEGVLGENWELNWTVLEGEKASISQLEEALSTAPFASPKRVVVLREALDFWKTWHKRERERTERALTQHAPHSLLILIHLGELEEKGMEEKILLETLQRSGVAVVSFTGKREALENWVKKRLAKEGLPVQQEVVDWLLDVSQGKMALLERELEKFVLWGKKGEDVQKIPSLWDVPLMVYKGDLRLLSLLEDLMAEKGYLYLFRIISSSLVRLAAVQQTLEEGRESREEAIRRVSRHPNERKALEVGLRRLTPAKTVQLLDRVMEAEISLKSGPLPPAKVLEKLIAQILEV
ncbi:MAG: DNA polymerase III subunit delta [Aquificota bacterium]|nr:MAG: DNA polymerase III subunit delta [Aquificota bacterium]